MADNRVFPVAEDVARLCVRQYHKLKKKGKPVAGKEWTPMAAFVVAVPSAHHPLGYTSEVVSLATGSKCIGEVFMDENGWVVNDSHAEVLARRGFVRYLMEQVRKAFAAPVDVEDPGALLEFIDASRTTLRLKPGCEVLFFATQAPCGDACIYEKSCSVCRAPQRDDTQQSASDVSPLLQGTHCDDQPPKPKRYKEEIPMQQPRIDTGSGGGGGECPHCRGDIHRTGAPCVREGPQDGLQSGAGYHVRGVLRTKPGRGPPSASMSCSDKMLRWNVLGCQGALLAPFLPRPLHIHHLVLGNDICFNRPAVERALWGRLQGNTDSSQTDHLEELRRLGYALHRPALHPVSLQHCLRGEGGEEGGGCFLPSEHLSPSPGSVCWSQLPQPGLQAVVVRGGRQGASQHQQPSSKTSIFLSKRCLFEEFRALLASLPDHRRPPALRRGEDAVTYLDHKKASRDYCQARAVFLEMCPTWLVDREERNSFK